MQLLLKLPTMQSVLCLCVLLRTKNMGSKFFYNGI